jgi:thymidylate synthase
MHLRFRNVNDAFKGLVQIFSTYQNGHEIVSTYEANSRTWGLNPVLLKTPIARKSSRNGQVLAIEEPMMITYEKPLERVLFNQARDTNPFALLYESLWMLAGRQDVGSLAFYTPRFLEFSDDGNILNDAYGRRWRCAPTVRSKLMEDPCALGTDLMQGRYPEVDQLDLLVAHLKASPDSRRAVLQMWTVEDDLLKVGGLGHRIRCPECYGTGAAAWQHKKDEFTGRCSKCNGRAWIDEPPSKAVCCNTEAMFSLRKNPICPTCHGEWTVERADQLDEAPPPSPCPNCTGDSANPYYHGWLLDMTVINRSNDLVWGLLGANSVTFSTLQEYLATRLKAEVGLYHHMTNNLHAYLERPDWDPAKWLEDDTEDWYLNPLSKATGENVPLVKDHEVWDKEVVAFCERFNGNTLAENLATEWQEPFLARVAQPMLIAWACHKERDYHSALAGMAEMAQCDWQVVARAWLEKRAGNYESKQARK